MGVHNARTMPAAATAEKPASYWTESDIFPTASGQLEGRRGMGRLVFGAKGEVWFSRHYRSDTWVQVREAYK